MILIIVKQSVGIGDSLISLSTRLISDERKRDFRKQVLCRRLQVYIRESRVGERAMARWGRVCNPRIGARSSPSPLTQTHLIPIRVINY